MTRLAASILTLFALLSPVSIAHASWQYNGTPATTATGNQHMPVITSDGAGGVIVAWNDLRSGGLNYDIYAQRISATGAALWTADGVMICNAANAQQDVAITKDGAGGAIIVWSDSRVSNTNYDIYAQRINSAGVAQWTANGIPICTTTGNQTRPQITSDESGGANIVWIGTGLSGQRINSAGTPTYAVNGIQIPSTYSYEKHVMVSDGAGNAFVAWQGLATQFGSFLQIYRAKLGGSMSVYSGGAYDHSFPSIAYDGTSGAAICAWQENHGSPSFWDIYVGRSDNGWSQVPVCTAAGDQTAPAVASDGAGGVYIAWTDARGGIYAQRVVAGPTQFWTPDGIAVCTSGNDAQIVADGNGNAIVVWNDYRNSPLSNTRDIYAQKLDGSGATQWTANGMAVSTGVNDQVPAGIVPIGGGNVIVGISDARRSIPSLGNVDVYAQRLEGRYGFWGNPQPVIASVADVKHDQGGKVRINFTASDDDVDGPRTITHYSIWRATDALSASNASLVTSPSKIGPDFHGTAFWHEQSAATDYYWEWIGNQDAVYNPGYSWTASTRADSTASTSATHYFQVIAHTSDNFVFFKSLPVSGRSVDNLAPPAPLYLTAQRSGANVTLKWNRVHVADLNKYSLYRKTSAGVTPVPSNFLADETDTLVVDSAAPATTLYYIVTATDVHGNQGTASNEAAVSSSTGVGNLPPLTSLMVLQNRPNPFASSSRFELGLPAASSVGIEVFDIAGRRVATHNLGLRPTGWQSIELTATDDAGHALASGVYFFRVSANGKTLTRKMVIAR